MIVVLVLLTDPDVPILIPFDRTAVNAGSDRVGVRVLRVLCVCVCACVCVQSANIRSGTRVSI